MDHAISTTVEKIFTAEAILASGSAYSKIFSGKQLSGAGTLQITLTGDGTGKFEIVGSNDEDALVTTFLKLSGSADIVTAFTVGTGLYTVTIPPVGRFAIKASETSTTHPIGVTAFLALK